MEAFDFRGAGGAEGPGAAAVVPADAAEHMNPDFGVSDDFAEAGKLAEAGKAAPQARVAHFIVLNGPVQGALADKIEAAFESFQELNADTAVNGLHIGETLIYSREGENVKSRRDPRVARRALRSRSAGRQTEGANCNEQQPGIDK